jgi:hypothetical protein
MNIPEKFGDYLIFVDESGDHGLNSIDPNFPIFTLVFVIIRKTDYLEKIVRQFQALKMKYWGHDQIILHEHAIRKEKDAFAILRTSSELRENFMSDLTEIIKSSPFKYVASIIHKDKLLEKYIEPFNPYRIGLLFCMEQALNILIESGQKGKLHHILIEARGIKEDKEIQLEFLQICNNERNWGFKKSDFQQLSFKMIPVDKKSNSTGLQLADLIVRPIALRNFRPLQLNNTYEILQAKEGSVKCFP